MDANEKAARDEIEARYNADMIKDLQKYLQRASEGMLTMYETVNVIRFVTENWLEGKETDREICIKHDWVD